MRTFRITVEIADPRGQRFESVEMLRRVCTVSVATMEIVDSMAQLENVTSAQFRRHPAQLIAAENGPILLGQPMG